MSEARKSEMLFKSTVAPSLSAFDEMMKESQKWAKEVGMTEADIDEAITAVRKKRKS